MFLNFQKKSRCFGETAWRWCFWERCWKTCWRRKESSPYSKKDYYSCSPWPIQFEGYPRLRTIPHRFRYEILGRGQMVSDLFCLKKDQIILATGRDLGRYLGSTWKTAEIFSICLIYNFLKPLKIWAHLENVYFKCFVGGDQREKFKKTMDSLGSDFEFFPFWTIFFWPTQKNEKLTGQLVGQRDWPKPHGCPSRDQTFFFSILLNFLSSLFWKLVTL